MHIYLINRYLTNRVHFDMSCSTLYVFRRPEETQMAIYFVNKKKMLWPGVQAMNIGKMFPN